MGATTEQITDPMLSKVKLALRIVTNAFDEELTELINAARIDIGIAGVVIPEASDALPIIERAIITYCKLNFGELDRIEMYDRLKAAYDEQKAQLSMSTGYTQWSGTM